MKDINKNTYMTIPCDTEKCCVETESYDEIHVPANSKSKACIIRQLSNTKAIVRCLWCGKEFETYYCKIKIGRGRYCSRHCVGKANGAARNIDKKGVVSGNFCKGEANANWQGGNFVDCEICGNPFWKYPYRKQTTCSHKCGVERAKLVHKGVLPSMGSRNQYNGIKHWKYLRQEVLERDNYICQNCGIQYKEMSQFLHVHHKVYLSEGGKNEVSNLITLCKECHFELHSKAGDLRKR
jgi:hypothetical protein